MSVFSERKIDCHNHIFDPLRFPFQPNVYHPQRAEIASADTFYQVLDTYGVSHALIVGPNSAYGENDNRALLDAIARSNGRCKGMAVVGMDTSLSQLQELAEQGIAGVTFNIAFYGVEHFADCGTLLDKIAQLDMVAQFQTEGAQLLALEDTFRHSGAKLLIDHCGRPVLDEGTKAHGFQAVLNMANTGRAWIKVSGFDKFSQQALPFNDVTPWVQEIKQAFGENKLIWGSDWPFLKARQRLDYGTLLALAEQQFPDPQLRQKYFWQNAAELLGFE